jgi:hypothetical protein
MLTTTWSAEPPNTDRSLATWTQPEAWGATVVLVVDVVESSSAVVGGAGGAVVVVVGARVELVTEDGGDVETSTGTVEEEQAEMTKANTAISDSARICEGFDIRRD